LEALLEHSAVVKGAVTARPEDLSTFVGAALIAEGVPSKDAFLLADTLVVAELWGHASHGLLRLPWYLTRLQTGAMEKVTTTTLVRDSGPVAVIDGEHGIGQVITERAVELAAERAREYGVGVVGVRNSGHFGTAAYFTRRLAERGLVGILATNASPAMAPWGAKQKAVGTNPWSIAAPAGDHGVLVMDLANTAVARGKIYLAAERGEKIPAGWAADHEGNPTFDARSAVEGLILPMAGPKGYVISFMMDVLAGVLTGSAFGADVKGPYEPKGRSGAGHLVIAIDVAAMADPAEYTSRVDALIEQTRSAERASWCDAILVPGELEDRARQRLEVEGIHLAPATWETLTTIAAEMNVPLPAHTHQFDHGGSRQIEETNG
jgi:LDH2 family malate/lactate/ureidoglycolate dehydrogenase